MSWQIRDLLEPRFLRNIKGQTLRDNDICNCNFKASLSRRNHFLITDIAKNERTLFIVHWFTFGWHARACNEGLCVWCFRDIGYRLTSVVLMNNILNEYGRLILYTYNWIIHLVQEIINNTLLSRFVIISVLVSW